MRQVTLQYRNSRPVYGELKDGLRRMIVSGALEPGERLPSVHAMAIDLAVNPNAVRRAYAELEAEGFIHALPGKDGFAARGGQDAGPRNEAELIRRLREVVAELRYLGLRDEEIIAAMKEGTAQ